LLRGEGRKGVGEEPNHTTARNPSRNHSILSDTHSHVDFRLSSTDALTDEQSSSPKSVILTGVSVQENITEPLHGSIWFSLFFQKDRASEVFRYHLRSVHCKKRFAVFPSPAGMSLTKPSLAENNLIIAAQGEFGK
jgi:hypothetical protein